MMRMGSDIKQQILSSVRKTWNTLAEFARSHRSSAVEMEKEVDSMLSSLNPTDENDTACELSDSLKLFGNKGLKKFYQL